MDILGLYNTQVKLESGDTIAVQTTSAGGKRLWIRVKDKLYVSEPAKTINLEREVCVNSAGSFSQCDKSITSLPWQAYCPEPVQSPQSQ